LGLAEGGFILELLLLEFWRYLLFRLARYLFWTLLWLELLGLLLFLSPIFLFLVSLSSYKRLKVFALNVGLPLELVGIDLGSESFTELSLVTGASTVGSGVWLLLHMSCSWSSSGIIEFLRYLPILLFSKFYLI